MELTHFERVLKDCDKHFTYAKSFAKKSVDKQDYAQCLQKAVDIPELSENVSDKVAVRHAIVAAQKAVACCHYLTMELLQRSNSYSFTTLTNNKQYRGLVRTVSMATDKLMLNTAGHMHYHLAAHHLAGKKVYAPSSGLAEQLRHTELRGLTSEDIKLPYPSIYLEVPESANLKVWNHETEWHRVVGLYITEEPEPRAWRFLVCGEVKPPRFVHHDLVIDNNDALVYFYVQLPEGASLEDSLEANQEECARFVEELRKEGSDTFNPMLDRWQGIFKWAMNVILYASMPGREIEQVTGNKKVRKLLDRAAKLPKGKKRTKLHDEMRGMDPRRRYVLGSSVTTQRGSWTLTVRVRVRGHWRNQPYGPERMWRRLQWIEPYWKGPEADMPAEKTG